MKKITQQKDVKTKGIAYDPLPKVIIINLCIFPVNRRLFCVYYRYDNGNISKEASICWRLVYKYMTSLKVIKTFTCE